MAMLIRSLEQMMKESTIASSKTESERARKRYIEVFSKIVAETDLYRLRTRVAYVQQSEETLSEKRKHCASFSAPSTVVAANHPIDKGVVDAFQNAMALLGGL